MFILNGIGLNNGLCLGKAHLIKIDDFKCLKQDKFCLKLSFYNQYYLFAYLSDAAKKILDALQTSQEVII